MVVRCFARRRFRHMLSRKAFYCIPGAPQSRAKQHNVSRACCTGTIHAHQTEQLASHPRVDKVGTCTAQQQMSIAIVTIKSPFMLNAVAKPPKRNMCTCSTAGTGPFPAHMVQLSAAWAQWQQTILLRNLFCVTHATAYAMQPLLLCIKPESQPAASHHQVKLALPATYPLFSTSDSSHHHDTHDEQYN